MSWLKVNVKLLQNQSDAEVADLITDGCNMGIKSLCKYMNQYTVADQESLNVAKQLVLLEEHLMVNLRSYL